MTTAQTLQRSIIVGLAFLGLALSMIGVASAHNPDIPDDAVVVSSTEIGSGSFMMTASNVGGTAIDLDLAAPGVVSNVSVDLGAYDGRWVIEGLGSGATATMTGALQQ